jgi:WD40 repeat protein
MTLRRPRLHPLTLAAWLLLPAVAACLLLVPAPARSQKPAAANTPVEEALAFGPNSTNLQGPPLWVESVAFSPDGKFLATAAGMSNTPGELRLWDRTTNEPLLTHKETTGVRFVTFAPDGKTFVSAHFNKNVNLWDVATRKMTGTFQGHTSGVNAAVFSPDGKDTRRRSGVSPFRRTARRSPPVVPTGPCGCGTWMAARRS